LDFCWPPDFLQKLASNFPNNQNFSKWQFRIENRPGSFFLNKQNNRSLNSTYGGTNTGTGGLRNSGENLSSHDMGLHYDFYTSLLEDNPPNNPMPNNSGLLQTNFSNGNQPTSLNYSNNNNSSGEGMMVHNTARNTTPNPPNERNCFINLDTKNKNASKQLSFVARCMFHFIFQQIR
jgi:hypothetical protein